MIGNTSKRWEVPVGFQSQVVFREAAVWTSHTGHSSLVSLSFVLHVLHKNRIGWELVCFAHIHTITRGSGTQIYVQVKAGQNEDTPVLSFIVVLLWLLI